MKLIGRLNGGNLCEVNISADGEEAICAIAPDIGFNKRYVSIEGLLEEWKLIEHIDYIRYFIDLERYANKLRGRAGGKRE